MEVDSSANEDGTVWKDENIDDETHLLETYLSESHIWQQLSALASEYLLPVQHSVARACSASEKTTLAVCIVPASGLAWPCAVRAHAPPSANISAQPHSISDAPLAIGVGNLYVPCGNEMEDLWAWARRYETSRRRREVKRATRLEKEADVN